MEKEFISLSQGSGSTEMDNLIRSFNFLKDENWKNTDNDAATYDLGDGKSLVFTSDSFIVTPIFFPGGDIGHLAFSGTVNDLLMMGSTPLGLSLSLVIEEGFKSKDLKTIIGSIRKLSERYNIPIVTGDTKVMERGKLDKIVINTSGIGIIDNNHILTKDIIPGDKIIISGGLGEHATALLSKRFDYETSIITDSRPLVEEMKEIKDLIKIAKDPTRGGIASILNEFCKRDNISIELDEQDIPAKEEVKKVVEMLGINLYELACEGRLVCIASTKDAEKVITILKRFNKDASIIGEVTSKNDDNKDNKVTIRTILGKRILPEPTGRIVPRIC